ncbi:MAG: type II toxin-antitoxin system PemK/MazF family toxin [Dehalococcoidales bacterium]|nr:type II toxin-antitoxin system PemK/MazF family toxin [Dehalococcoidales bacterium]
MHRGEIRWAELPAPVGRRPVLLLSRESAYNIRTSITVAVITRTIRSIPVEVPIGKEDGMPEKCVVNLDNILTIPKTRLGEHITRLSPKKMVAVSKAIVFALDLNIK